VFDRVTLRCSVKTSGLGGVADVTPTTISYPDAGGRIGAPLCVLLFEVHDTGIGIKANDIPKVSVGAVHAAELQHLIGTCFALFAQLFTLFSKIQDKAIHDPQGSGLGLVIVRKIVQLMGGQVALQSDYGIGTCFSFTVPDVGGGEPVGVDDDDDDAVGAHDDYDGQSRQSTPEASWIRHGNGRSSNSSSGPFAGSDSKSSLSHASVDRKLNRSQSAKIAVSRLMNVAGAARPTVVPEESGQSSCTDKHAGHASLRARKVRK
jgi:hypothetical protein